MEGGIAGVWRGRGGLEEFGAADAGGGLVSGCQRERVGEETYRFVSGSSNIAVMVVSE